MDIETLRRSVRGTVVTADDAAYAATREGLLFNRRGPGRRPAVIVRAAGVDDVRAAVRFAAANGLRVSPRGSGHNWSGIAIQEGVVVDLGAMDRVVVDAGARLAEAEPAISARALAETLAGYGLAFPVGHCGTVAMSGYLLGGGFGWNSGSWGLGCHNVESVEVVLADGSLRRASALENPEIFWAVRGGGPAFFGIVVRYRLRLQPLPRVMKAALWAYPLERFAEVEGWMGPLAAAGRRTLEVSTTMASAPPPLAGRAARVALTAATVFADSEAEADAILAAVAAAAPAGALDAHGPMPVSFGMLYDLTAPMYPAGMRNAVDCFWAASPETSFLGTIAERVATAPFPRVHALALVLPPPPGPLPDAAFSMGGAIYAGVHAVWESPEDDAKGLAWLRGTADAVADRTIGHYVGETDHDRPGRLEACFSPAAWVKLAVLRRRYDPAGVFDRTGAATVPLRAAG